jgi:hypothetical protein
LCSHDTLGRGLKQLATPTLFEPIGKQKRVTISAKDNQYNGNSKLNEMLVKATKKMGALKEGSTYILHIDAMYIPTMAASSEMAYNKNYYGYNALVCLINDLPVYINLRNGNTNATFQLKECLEECLNILAKNKIKIGKVISDGAGYNKILMEMLDKRKIKFNIHTHFSHTFKKMINEIENIENWKAIELETGHGFRSCEISEIEYSMFGYGNKTKYRIIVARELNSNLKSLNESEEETERREMVEIKPMI